MEEKPNNIDNKNKQSKWIECPICLEVFTNPKSVLPCLHTFCERCLIKSLSQGKKECPSCRGALKFKENQTIEAYVGGLPLNFVINDLLDNLTPQGKTSSNLCDHCADPAEPATSFCAECEEFFCAIHDPAHRRGKRTATHPLLPVGGEKEAEVTKKSLLRKTCLRHQGQRLELFCFDCDETICRDCPLDQHCGHKYRLLAAAGEEEQEILTALLKKVAEPLSRLTKVYPELKEAEQKLDQSIKDAKQQIEEGTNTLIKALENRRATLMNEVDALGGQERKKLKSHKGTVKSLIMVAKKAEEMQRDSNPIELLHVKKFLQLTVEQMKDIRFSNLGIIHTEVPWDELVPKIQQLGVTAIKPQFLSAHVNALTGPYYSARVSKSFQINRSSGLAVDPRSGNIFTVQNDKLQTIDPETGVILKEVKLKGTYHKAFAVVDPADGSIFLSGGRGVVDVYSGKGQHKKAIGKGLGRGGLALDHKRGQLIVGDSEERCLKRFSVVDGSLISRTAVEGIIHSVCFDPRTDHVILVKGHAGFEVVIIGEDGGIIGTIGKRMSNIPSVTVDEHGQIIMSNGDGGRIEIFSPDGDLKAIIGDQESLSPDAVYEHSLAVDPTTGSLFVLVPGRLSNVLAFYARIN